jgi:hypothetical protein
MGAFLSLWVFFFSIVFFFNIVHIQFFLPVEKPTKVIFFKRSFVFLLAGLCHYQ